MRLHACFLSGGSTFPPPLPFSLPLSPLLSSPPLPANVPQGFDRWVPSSCLSNTCTLSTEKQWAALGRDEVCALLLTLAAALPTRREVRGSAWHSNGGSHDVT